MKGEIYLKYTIQKAYGLCTWPMLAVAFFVRGSRSYSYLMRKRPVTRSAET